MWWNHSSSSCYRPPKEFQPKTASIEWEKQREIKAFLFWLEQTIEAEDHRRKQQLNEGEAPRRDVETGDVTLFFSNSFLKLPLRNNENALTILTLEAVELNVYK